MKNTLKSWIELSGMPNPVKQAEGPCALCGDRIDWKLKDANEWRGTYELICEHGNLRWWLDVGGAQ